MILKLCALYPLGQNEDAEVKLAAYLEELRDVPSLVLSHGLKRLVQRSAQFCPPVAEIRHECALYLRERHRAASGQDPHTPPLGGELNVERWLERARDPLPALPVGQDEERATPEQRARGSAILERLVREKGVR